MTAVALIIFALPRGEQERLPSASSSQLAGESEADSRKLSFLAANRGTEETSFLAAKKGTEVITAVSLEDDDNSSVHTYTYTKDEFNPHSDPVTEKIMENALVIARQEATEAMDLYTQAQSALEKLKREVRMFSIWSLLLS